MIVPVAITNRVTKALSGIDRDYVPVAADLADGWTLCARCLLYTSLAIVSVGLKWRQRWAGRNGLPREDLVPASSFGQRDVPLATGFGYRNV